MTNVPTNDNLNYDYEVAIALENTIQPFETILEIFSPHLYEKYIKAHNLSGKEYKLINKGLKRIYTGYEKVINRDNKRKKDYLLLDLINEDGSPIPRIDNRRNNGSSKHELTKLFTALLLLALHNNEIDDKTRTTKKWLEYFGIISNRINKDYNLIINPRLDGKKFFSDTKEAQSFIAEKSTQRYNNYLNLLLTFSKMLDDDILIREYENKKVGSSITENETAGMFKNSYNTYVDILKRKFNTLMTQLDSKKMIKYRMYKIGVTKQGDNIELNSKQLHQLTLLETRVKEELDIHGVYGYQLYANFNFRNKLNSILISEGLKVDGEIIKLEYVYSAYTITKNFTSVELADYLNENEDIKEYYEQANEILVDKYRLKRLDAYNRAMRRKINGYNLKLREAKEELDKFPKLVKTRLTTEHREAKKKVSKLNNNIEYENKNLEFGLKMIDMYKDGLDKFSDYKKYD
ncbi:hypothetical protein [Macrococcoides caseolyticum]|uniref:hypothetical protein n=1 Tax=Macrococcoides caseolyticum TaxID=69966 RepID=UPI000C34100B|nr:hypothetical protein [Macrococcus caseolyticus]PKE22434.1 hypothetical protein CW688_01800 [Macrococcus caseolyticus]PKE35877.1 hypothetical protein CW695_06455 [Macrococcus caseolyticus]PKE73169.1 hypothetical protein CW665_01685 [Macrococcus caseolyticus]PKE74744.1 hypothetical protein CW670_05155 [Macrococcus caseolyticus]PKF07735.1 hypothetical protein CW698_02620 [Macrococcus caseolyticus]